MGIWLRVHRQRAARDCQNCHDCQKSPKLKSKPLTTKGTKEHKEGSKSRVIGKAKTTPYRGSTRINADQEKNKNLPLITLMTLTGKPTAEGGGATRIMAEIGHSDWLKSTIVLAEVWLSPIKSAHIAAKDGPTRAPLFLLNPPALRRTCAGPYLLRRRP